MKISDEEHKAKMAERRTDQLLRRVRARAPVVPHKAKFIGDGFDEQRIKNAQIKRQLKVQ